MDVNLFFAASGGVFLLGFWVSDVIMSRALFACAAGLLVYGGVTAASDISLLAWGTLALSVNLIVIWRHMSARYSTPPSAAELALHKELPGFSKSDFRRLMKLAQWETLDAPKQLTEQGLLTETLYYIVSGAAQVKKGDSEITVGEHVLIGEISFAQNMPATASVTAAQGTTLIGWPSKKLHKLLKRKSLKASFDDLLAHDLADKLAADEMRRKEPA